MDIARGIYTLKFGKVISKTKAAEWALENGICPVPDDLKIALTVRKSPMDYVNDERIFDCAERLNPKIQEFADVMEGEIGESR